MNALDYWRERGYLVHENQNGFAIFKVTKEECYLQILYIAPGIRRAKLATVMADEISFKATKAGCKYLTTSINTNDGINVTRSMKAILSYGFEYAGKTDYGIFFKKDLPAIKGVV